ncbi:MAG: adenine-specific methylase [Chthonomonadaceae bacterium]|nr:adenine-specific methylase [Chthonomonadaceae bacterium]
MSLESRFDAAFTASLALREKQIQQSYRPVIGVHKWFARRPGTLFRNLLLAEFNGTEAPGQAFYRSHGFQGVIADPFMGGGTPLIEANRLGFHVVGADINPMAYWIVRQEIGQLSADALAELSRERAARGRRAFEVVACIDGRGFGIRREDMRRLLIRTNGKVFTLRTLDQLLPHTGIGRFAVSQGDRTT